MKNVAIIVAAGKGERFKSDEYKPFVPLDDKPIIVHTLTKFEPAENADAVVLLVPEPRLDRAEELVAAYRLTKVIDILPGGAERYETVKKGLDNLPADT